MRPRLLAQSFVLNIKRGYKSLPAAVASPAPAAVVVATENLSFFPAVWRLISQEAVAHFRGSFQARLTAFLAWPGLDRKLPRDDKPD